MVPTGMALPLAETPQKKQLPSSLPTSERGGEKEGQYDYGVFNLHTAMKAYDIIMPPTNVAGREATDVLVLQLLRDKHARELQDLQDKHESGLKRNNLGCGNVK